MESSRAHQPLFGLPSSPHLRPPYHEPAPFAVGNPKSGGLKYAGTPGDSCTEPTPYLWPGGRVRHGESRKELRAEGRAECCAAHEPVPRW